MLEHRNEFCSSIVEILLNFAEFQLDKLPNELVHVRVGTIIL